VDRRAPPRQEQLILSDCYTPEASIGPEFRSLIERGRAMARKLQQSLGPRLAAYIRLICAALRLANLLLSPRRAVMLLRNLCGVHTARLLLNPAADLSGSAFLALRHSIPQRATGESVKELALVAAHKEAWKMTQLEAECPLRILLFEPDPLRRALLAAGFGQLDRQEFSTIVSDCLTILPTGTRHALATHLFETGIAGRLVAAVAQQCAEWYSVVATPQNVRELVQSGGVRHKVWQHTVSVLARFPAEDPETPSRTNLLTGLFARNVIQVEDDVDHILEQWHKSWSVIRGSRP
jgi:hypothetical protein